MSRVANKYDYFATIIRKDLGRVVFQLVLGGEVSMARHHPSSLVCGTERY